DARHGKRLGGVELGDARMSVRAPQDVEVEHPWEFDVVDVRSLAADEARVLLALDRVAEPTDCCTLSGSHRLVLPSTSRHAGRRRGFVRLLHLLGRVLDRLDDVHVAGAPAEVAGDRLPDLRFRRVRVTLQQGNRRHHHARRAEAALEPVLLPEALLHRVEFAVLLKPLDGTDLAAVGLHREDGARLDRYSVEMDGAGTATGGVAADV